MSAIVYCLLSTLPITVAEAQITLDGSLGPRGALSGPGYVIPAGVGQLRGTNLFHSFGQFNVQTGETATFTGPSSVTNVLSRVTGGQRSTIDGLISTRAAMPNANFFLLNPAGVLFGPNATLDVGGAVRVSTADYLRFADGAAFVADLARESTLSVADVTAFGFLRAPTAGLTVDSSFLQLDPGQTLLLVGGGIQVSGGVSAGNTGGLVANSGRIEIASVASAGEVTLVNAAGARDLGVTSFSRLGPVTISDGAVLDVSGAPGPSGSVVIRGGQLVVDQATISANTTGAIAGGLAVDIQVTGDAVFTSSAVRSATSGSGDAGDIHVAADTLRLDNFAAIESITEGSGRGSDIVVGVGSLHVTNGSAIATTNVPSETFPGGGPGGTVTVTARNSVVVDGGGGLATISAALTPTSVGGDLAISAPSVTLSNGAFVLALTFGDAAGGRVDLQTQRLSIAGGARIESHSSNGPGGVISVTATESALLADAGSGILSSGFLTGTGETAAPAGEIAVTAGQLTITRDAVIQSGSLLEGASNISVAATGSIEITDGGGIVSLAFLNDVGSLTVSAPTVVVSRGLILASTTGTGRAGDIIVNVGDLTLSNGGQIVTSSILGSAGSGGNLTVNATGPVTISGASSAPVFDLSLNSNSGLFSTAEAVGPAGTINVSTPALIMTDGGTISVATSGQGRGGDINIAANSIELLDGASLVASSTGTAEALAGNINLTFGDSLRLENSSITTSSIAADGGNVTITATGSVLYLLDSQITTSVVSAVGQGGNISIGTTAHPLDFVVLNNSQVLANAFGGPGGNITILTDGFITQNGVLDASSALSTPGTISIQAETTTVSGALTQLPANVLQAATLLRASCAARLAQGRTSTLVVAGREGVPPEPDGLLWSPMAEILEILEPRKLSLSDSYEWQLLPKFPRVSLTSKCEG